jgi:hypothetical protein
LEFFRFLPSAYWSCHLSFEHPSPRAGIAVGRTRADEIIVNTILPFTLLIARTFRTTDIEHNAILLYRTLPATPPNSITLRVRRCLLPTFPRLSTAQLNQGALDLCTHLCNSGPLRM